MTVKVAKIVGGRTSSTAIRVASEREQYDDGRDGDEEMLHQLVDFVVGGLAVITGHGDGHVIGNQAAIEAPRRLDDFLRHAHGIGALAFGHAKGDRLTLFAGDPLPAAPLIRGGRKASLIRGVGGLGG